MYNVYVRVRIPGRYPDGVVAVSFATKTILPQGVSQYRPFTYYVISRGGRGFSNAYGLLLPI